MNNNQQLPAGIDSQDFLGSVFEVTPSQAAIGLAIFIVGSILAKFVSILARKTMSRQGRTELTSLVASRAARWGTIMVGLLVALSWVGININALLGLLGLFGFAIALAFRGVLENFVAGLALLFQQPFELGDVVTTGEQTGRVANFSLRSTTLLTVEALTIHIPNAQIVTEPLINATTSGHQRTTVAIGVAYGTDLKQAAAVLLDAANKAAGVHPQPPAEVWFTDFGDSSINFGVEFFHDPTAAALEETVHNVGLAVESALASANIEIPFPQQVNHTAQ